MNYANHNLRTQLQEWKNRIYRSNYDQFPNQVQFFFQNLKSNSQLSGIIKETISKYNYEEVTLEENLKNMIRSSDPVKFENHENQAAYCYQIISYFNKKHDTYELNNYRYFSGKDFEEKKNGIIEDFVSPIIYFLHDKLDKSNSIIYLLEKYKKRTEWFNAKSLINQYNEATSNFEQIFEDDLRLFLFDQGIEYPFSTPLSNSGRPDIIGNIETDDPLVCEIKIFDRNKSYGKNRIKEGFTQAVKYSNDYNKDVGYIVIFNTENIELNLNFDNEGNIFPPEIKFNNKIFYFIAINLNQDKSASKQGTLTEILINTEELTK